MCYATINAGMHACVCVAVCYATINAGMHACVCVCVAVCYATICRHACVCVCCGVLRYHMQACMRARVCVCVALCDWCLVVTNASKPNLRYALGAFLLEHYICSS